jgi:NAD-dependent dihydropyrimidine dehydrogenase PreA subunit
MTYVIDAPCIDVEDSACVEECPVDRIYVGARTLYIHPDECVDCGACAPMCPVEAREARSRGCGYRTRRRPPRHAGAGRDRVRLDGRGPSAGMLMMGSSGAPRGRTGAGAGQCLAPSPRTATCRDRRIHC